MKRKEWIIGALVASVVGTTPVMAAEAGKTVHREVEPPKSTAEACLMLRRDGAELQRLLKKKRLDGVDLHNIHMLSYGLREAVAFLNTRWDQIAEIANELHKVSESGSAEKTQAYGQSFLQQVREAFCPQKRQ